MRVSVLHPGAFGATDADWLCGCGCVQYKPAEKAEVAVLGHGPTAPVGSSTVEVPYMPSTAQEHNSDGESDEDECDDRPLTRDELQEKTFKNIGKKEKLLGKGRVRRVQK